jgi:hypothetical protein
MAYNVETVAAQIVIASDRKRVELNNDSFREDRTRASQSVVWAFYAMPQSVEGKSKSGHQFGARFGKSAGDSVFMPSREVFELTGNPYIDYIDHAGNVVSDKRYNANRFFVLYHHAMFEYMIAHNEPLAAQDFLLDSSIVESAQTLAEKCSNGKRTTFNTANVNGNAFFYSVAQALSELEACGLVIPTDTKRNGKTLWIIEPSIRTLIETVRASLAAASLAASIAAEHVETAADDAANAADDASDKPADDTTPKAEKRARKSKNALASE